MKSYSKLMRHHCAAFTLAEMMVVMLIMSIILACMAPAVTTKMKADRNAQTSPWKWANASDIYFGLGSAQTAMLGQREKGVGEDAKLIIHNPTESVQDMILFKQNNNAVGRLRIDGEGLLLGTLSNGSTLPSDSIALGISTNPSISSIAIGSNTTAQDSSVVIGVSSAGNAEYSVVIGEGASTSDIGGTAVGQGASASNISVALGQGATAGDSSVAIGQGSNAVDSGIALGQGSNAGDTSAIAIGQAAVTADVQAIAIGCEATASISSVSIGEQASAEEDGVAVGAGSVAGGRENIAIGRGAHSAQGQADSGSIAIGTEAISNTSNSIAIGTGANAGADGVAGISIGRNARTDRDGLAIGENAIATGDSCLSIGYGSDTKNGQEAIAIGNRTVSYGADSVALGVSAKANSSNVTAIGARACTNAKGTNVTCLGANSGPKAGTTAVSISNAVYLGTENTTVYIPGNLIVRGNVDLGLAYGTTHIRTPGSAGKAGYWTVDNAGGFLKEWGTPPTTDNYWSDRRLKYVGKENKDGLSKLRQLKIFNYTYKKDEAKIPHVGVIAQDLQKVFPNAVKKGADGFLTIRMEDMFYAVINAIKELDAKYQAQEKRINELENRIKILEAKIK